MFFSAKSKCSFFIYGAVFAMHFWHVLFLPLPYKMIASLQKRRNQSTESPYDHKFYLKRTHGNSALLPHPPSALKDRLPNRTLAYPSPHAGHQRPMRTFSAKGRLLHACHLSGTIINWHFFKTVFPCLPARSRPFYGLTTRIEKRTR